MICTLAVALLLFSLHLAVGAGMPEAAYETLCVFKVGANPQLGADAPFPLRCLLWAGRFLAPLLTAGTIAEAAHGLGVFHLPTLYLRIGWFPRQHVVVVGLSRLGVHLCRHFVNSGEPVVAIEKNADHPDIVAVRAMGVPVIVGDATLEGIRAEARVSQAARVVAVTNHDLVNAEVALATARSWEGAPTGNQGGSRVWAQIADTRLRNALPGLLKQDLARRVRVFSSYAWAAQALADEPEHTQARPCLYVVAGLGRFGAALLEAIAGKDRHPDSRFLVVDPNLPAWTETSSPWANLPGAERIAYRRTDMLNPLFLDEVVRAGQSGLSTHFFVCTDSDPRNLKFALGVAGHLRGRGVGIQVVTRMFDSRALEPEFSNLGIRLVGIDVLFGRPWWEEWRDATDADPAPTAQAASA